VRPDGSLVPDRFEHDRSNRIVQQLEAEFGLIPAKGRSQGEVWRIAPVDAAAGDLKRQVANVIKPLAEMYRFRSLSEYRALLSLYNIGVEKVDGDNKGHRYEGLVYSVLDVNGNRVGKPLKSSLFGKKYGVAHLEERMQRSGEAIKAGNAVATTKATVSAALTGSRDGSEFRAALREKGIDLVLRSNDQGCLYGVTFIDHNSRTVLNGSALGKEFSANALSARFADICRETTQAPTPTAGDRDTPTVVSAPAEHSPGTSIPAEHPQAAPDTPVAKTPPPTVRPESGDRATASHSDTPDLSPIGDAAGSLFSILTPDTGGEDNNHSGPKRRKKKKRQYGQQT